MIVVRFFPILPGPSLEQGSYIQTCLIQVLGLFNMIYNAEVDLRGPIRDQTVLIMMELLCVYLKQ